jgi:hypothetical protein
VDDLDDYLGRGGGETCKEMDHDCKVCGASFKKPAHLRQHMQSHSLETISLFCYIWMCEALDPRELQNARRP